MTKAPSPLCRNDKGDKLTPDEAEERIERHLQDLFWRLVALRAQPHNMRMSVLVSIYVFLYVPFSFLFSFSISFCLYKEDLKTSSRSFLEAGRVESTTTQYENECAGTFVFFLLFITSPLSLPLSLSLSFCLYKEDRKTPLRPFLEARRVESAMSEMSMLVSIYVFIYFYFYLFFSFSHSYFLFFFVSFYLSSFHA